MTEKQNSNQNPPPILWRMQEEKSILFFARDDVTVRAAWTTSTQHTIEMWRDSAGVMVPPAQGNMGKIPWRKELAAYARTYPSPPPGKDEEKPKDTVPHLDEDLG